MNQDSSAASGGEPAAQAEKSPSIGQLVVAAAVATAGEVLSTHYKVPENEVEQLVSGLRAILHRLFGHHR